MREKEAEGDYDFFPASILLRTEGQKSMAARAGKSGSRYRLGEKQIIYVIKSCD